MAAPPRRDRSELAVRAAALAYPETRAMTRVAAGAGPRAGGGAGKIGSRPGTRAGRGSNVGGATAEAPDRIERRGIEASDGGDAPARTRVRGGRREFAVHSQSYQIVAPRLGG